ncbi:MAG TPA: DUF2520 domain-containing protein [Chitinophagaceae bacterium]|jgi:predicted short-subunit dehydrogenase-like oxidoreductase (DUF2520 family)|nr:DUF2520 domain-containing protein [Chitinophagaceae bacterium]
MEIVIIGTGNTATILGRKLKEAGHVIAQVYGRNPKDASDLAYDLETESTNYWSVVRRDADLYLIAVSDIAVKEVIKELDMTDKTIVHTAASVSKEVLKKADHYGVFYPLQSLNKHSGNLPRIPIIIDASDETTFQLLSTLAHSISEQVIVGDDEKRLKLHLAAVLVNNFTNHIYALAEDFCMKEGIDFQLLTPLIDETTNRLQTISPSNAQTGPAIRHDATTIKEHLSLLKEYPRLKNLYKVFTDSIQNVQ